MQYSARSVFTDAKVKESSALDALFDGGVTRQYTIHLESSFYNDLLCYTNLLLPDNSEYYQDFVHSIHRSVRREDLLFRSQSMVLTLVEVV